MASRLESLEAKYSDEERGGLSKSSVKKLVEDWKNTDKPLEHVKEQIERWRHGEKADTLGKYPKIIALWEAALSQYEEYKQSSNCWADKARILTVLLTRIAGGLLASNLLFLQSIEQERQATPKGRVRAKRVEIWSCSKFCCLRRKVQSYLFQIAGAALPATWHWAFRGQQDSDKASTGCA